MAEVTMDDINAVLNSTPVFAQAVRLEAANRRIEELEGLYAESVLRISAMPDCDCPSYSQPEEPEE